MSAPTITERFGGPAGPEPIPATQPGRGSTMQAHHRRGAAPRSSAADETIEQRLLLALSFPVFLAAALLSRLAPGARRPAGKRKSVLAEARQAAHTCIPFAFMG